MFVNLCVLPLWRGQLSEERVAFLLEVCEDFWRGFAALVYYSVV